MHDGDVCPCGGGDTRDIDGALWALCDLGREVWVAYGMGRL